MNSPASRATAWRRCIWIAYWLAIFTATHLPPSSQAMRLAFRLPDWLLHAGAYAGLGALVAWAASARPSARLLAIWFAILLAYGVFDERSQPLVGRSCELSDWLADAIGALAGLTVVGMWRRREKSSHA